jgi:hypothetical protein
MLAKDLLGIPKVEDLWHGQNTISRGTAGPLAAKVEQATTMLATAHEVETLVTQGRAAEEQRSQKTASSKDWDARETCATQAIQSAEATLKEATENQASMQQAVCDLGTVLHPIDLKTGELQDAPTVEKGLLVIFALMFQIAQNACLGERSLAALRKAERLVSAWVAAVAHWHALVEKLLADLAQPTAVVELVRTLLIPVLYLSRVIRQTRDAARREELRAVRALLLGRLMEPGGLWQTLPRPLRRTLLALAQDCVNLFQRSTGCIEGRNGQLSLYQHHSRGLGPALLMALTVVHNFVITRADGTTAAMRFFGRAPSQSLFDHLCQVLPPPARPRKRSQRPDALLALTI